MSDDPLLDVDTVTAYLAKNLKGFEGPVEARKFPVGQSNPTFHLKTPDRDYVLRRKPPGQLLKSAHAVDREFRVQSALADTPVPVPRMHMLCQDHAILGTDFYIMEMVEGRNFPLPTLDELSAADRSKVSVEMCRFLAELHTVDLNSVGLDDFGPKGNYLERQFGRWRKQYEATQTENLPDMTKLIQLLERHMPPDDGQRTLVHGDYRIDNMMFEVDGTKLVALLDWELSTTGHPYADLASVLMQWMMPATESGRGLAGIDRAAHGLPSDNEFVAAYAQYRGREVEDLNYFVAFCCFRMAAILQGVYRRALDGNASNPETATMLGQTIPLFAQNGLAALDRP